MDNALIERATEYRLTLSAPQQEKGVVVMNQSGEACGWVNELRNPEHWEPGCIAIDLDGNCWLATGGDSYNGAEQWIPKSPNVRGFDPMEAQQRHTPRESLMNMMDLTEQAQSFKEANAN